MPIFVCFNQILILQNVITVAQFQQQIELDFPNFSECRFLLAVSGGADSMVLAHLFNSLQISFGIAHVNYHLRDEDSNLDEELVKNFAELNQIPFFRYSVTEKDEKPEGSIQIWARDLRYAFFEKIQKEHDFDILVTAHHLDDQLETFLINLGRGSGIKGLTGIPSNEKVYRPLSKFSKQEIYDFAEVEKIDFREDYTNKKDDYLRNKLRNQIIPNLKETNSQFLENFETSISHLQSVEKFAQEQVDLFFKTEFSKIENRFEVEKSKLEAANSYLQYEILKKFGFKNPEENQKLFTSETGKYFQSKSHKVFINRDHLLFIPLEINQEGEQEIILIPTKNDLDFSLKFFVSAEILGLEKQVNNIWLYDLEKLVFPIKIRKWKTADYFYPIGMDGKKKVSKFFKDEKFSILAKQKTWLLCDGEDRVLGIIPQRQDGRFAQNKVRDNTLQLRF